MPTRSYYVYIMTNPSRTLYVGVTNDLERRVNQHRLKEIPGFTAKYNITQLVYYEETSDILVAIAREKTIKGWLRAKKIGLIESTNPSWQDLTAICK
ncbi:MAG: GIY-YIG nuclease family protein [Candidatus Binatia bacterium]